MGVLDLEGKTWGNEVNSDTISALVKGWRFNPEGRFPSGLARATGKSIGTYISLADMIERTVQERCPDLQDSTKSMIQGLVFNSLYNSLPDSSDRKPKDIVGTNEEIEPYFKDPDSIELDAIEEYLKIMQELDSAIMGAAHDDEYIKEIWTHFRMMPLFVLNQNMEGVSKRMGAAENPIADRIRYLQSTYLITDEPLDVLG